MQTEIAKDAAPAAASPSQEIWDDPLPSSLFPVEMSEYPAPRVITENEMSLVVTCLQRWRNEVEQDIKGLRLPHN